MLISTLTTLLTPDRHDNALPEPSDNFQGHWTSAPERHQLHEAVLSGDDAQIDRSIELMVARVAPELTIHRQLANSRRQTRQQSLERRLRQWVEGITAIPNPERRRQTLELNDELRQTLSALQIHNTPTQAVLTAQQRPVPLEGWFPEPATVRVDRRVWARASTRSGRRQRRPAAWSDQEIIAALQEWAARHGQPPNSCEWITGSPDRPGSLCVRRRFGSWERALKRAGLRPNARAQHRFWSDAEILAALRAWTKRHGRAPKANDWTRAQRSHPCTRSVGQHFGTFRAAVVAAGLTPA